MDASSVTHPLSPTFVAWCDEQGVKRLGIEAAFVQDGWRGVIATDKIKNGQVILSCPASCLLSNEQIKSSPLEAICPSGTKLKPNETLAVLLLYEVSKAQSREGPTSRWEPYLRTLPKGYTCLCSFTEEEAQAFQLDYAIEATVSSIEAVKESWRRVQGLMEGIQLPKKLRTHSAYLWAHQTLTSRTMFLPSDTAGCLTPFGDLFNYCSPPPPFTPRDVFSSNPAATQEREALEDGSRSVGGDGHLDSDSGHYLIIARQDYEIGQQVLLCYGAHTNLELLTYYGFILDSNPHDKVQIPLDQLRFRKDTAPLKHSESFIHADGCPSWQLLKALRVMALNSKPQQRELLVIEAGERSSWADDLKAMSILKEICIGILKSFKSSLEDDEEELRTAGGETNDDGLEERKTLALRWKLSIRRIMIKCIHRIDGMQ